MAIRVAASANRRRLVPIRQQSQNHGGKLTRLFLDTKIQTDVMSKR
jgi:hypothetical protein